MQAPHSVNLNDGRSMPLLGLGVYDMHDRVAEQAILWALETGYRLLDTASIYQNEKEVGHAIRESKIPRQELFITTKVDEADQGYDSTLRAYDTSLKNLQCDYVDLYLVHWPVKHLRKQTWLALEQLYRQGRVRSIGVSNYLTPFLKELESYATVIPSVDQVEFSPYLYLKDLLIYCRGKKIILQAYTPLVRGLRMQDPKLLQVAAKYNKTPAQIILRWILQHGVSAIPKSSSLVRIKENFDVFDFELKAEDLSYIDGFNENLRVVDDPMNML